MAFLAFIGAIVAFCALAVIVSGCIYLALNLRAMAETPETDAKVLHGPQDIEGGQQSHG